MERLPRQPGREGLITKALVALGWKAASDFATPLELRNPEGWPTERVAAGVTVNETSVLALSAAWACVNLLAGTIASLPLMVYRQAGGERTVAKDHPLYRVLHDSPNYDQTAMDFWEGGVAALELRGDLIARVERSGDRVVALHPVSGATVRREASGSLRYLWTESGRAWDEPQERMLHVRGFGGSPLGGMSTLAHGRQVFGLSRAVNETAATTFANGVRPSLILATPGDKTLTKDQRDGLEGALQEKHQGAMNSGRPMLVEGGITPHQVSFSPEDAQMLESRAFSVEEVCRLFGVPPHMVGHTEKSTSWGTGLEQQTLAFQKFTLRKRLKRIEQALEKQLLTPADRVAGVSIEFNLEGLLRGDSAGRATFYKDMTAMGAMTINEVRALENLPPVAGGDVPRMQAQNVPINMANPPALGAGGE